MKFRCYISISICFLGKPVHNVELLLAEQMYKLRDYVETFEFYGPPHPEDVQGTRMLFFLFCIKSKKLFEHRSNIMDTSIFRLWPIE